VRKEHRPGQIPPKDLDSIMARFFLGVLKMDGTEYEPDFLGSMYNSLDRHLRDMKSPIRYILTFLSDRLITIGRVSAKAWRGPNYKVLKHTVLFGTYDIIFNIHNA
jgi:hypothetical protein